MIQALKIADRNDTTAMTPNGNAEVTKRNIVRIALEIVSEDGLAALTAGNLIKRAGISKGGLYHHFRQMDDVAQAALRLMIDEMIEALPKEPVADFDTFMDGLERHLFDFYLDRPQLVRAKYSFLAVAMFGEIYRSEMQRFMRAAQELLAENIGRFYGDRLSPERINDVVRMADAFIYGMTIVGYIQRMDDSRAAWREFRLLLSHSLAESALMPVANSA